MVFALGELVMKLTMFDLCRRMPEVLQALDRNGKVTILYHGMERAVLLPAGADQTDVKTVRADAHAAFGMWADNDDLDDVAARVQNLRRGRNHAL